VKPALCARGPKFITPKSTICQSASIPTVFDSASKIGSISTLFQEEATMSSTPIHTTADAPQTETPSQTQATATPQAQPKLEVQRDANGRFLIGNDGGPWVTKPIALARPG
jgi:hypothetical protein